MALSIPSINLNSDNYFRNNYNYAGSLYFNTGNIVPPDTTGTRINKYDEAAVINTKVEAAIEANYNNIDNPGTLSKNNVDAAQSIYINGVSKVAGRDLFNGSKGSISLTDTDGWALQLNQAKVTEMYIYAGDEGFSHLNIFTGSSQNDSFTFSGEDITGFHGGLGFDVIRMSGNNTDLDVTSLNNGIDSIELINLQGNGSNANQLTINNSQLDSNGSILSVLMGANDTVVYKMNTLSYASATQEMVVFATNLDDEINMSIFNEVVYGRGGEDTFIYNSWSDVASASTDTIVDFGAGANGDVIDLSDLLTYSDGDNLSNFVEVTGGNVDGGDVTIKIDKDGSNAFNAADQTIILTGVGSTTTDVTLDLLNEQNFVVL